MSLVSNFILSYLIALCSIHSLFRIQVVWNYMPRFRGLIYVNRVRVLRYILYNTNSTRIGGDCWVHSSFSFVTKACFDEIVLKIEMLTKWDALAGRRCFCRFCERHNGVHEGTLGGQWSVDGFRDPARALFDSPFRAPHETRYRRRLSSYHALKN